MHLFPSAPQVHAPHFRDYTLSTSARLLDAHFTRTIHSSCCFSLFYASDQKSGSKRLSPLGPSEEVWSLRLTPAQVALTKYLRPGGLKNRHLFSILLEAASPRSRCQQGWFLLRLFSLACRHLPSHCVFTWAFLCACASQVSLPLIRTPVILD